MSLLSYFRENYSLSWALIIAVAVKFFLFALGIAIIGSDVSRTSLSTCGAQGNIGASVFSSPYADLESYTDYRDLYMRCLVTPFLNGSGAYNLPIVNNYPPLFLYLLAGFALVNVVWFSAIPLIIFDILTVIPIYKITNEFLTDRNGRVAFLVSLLWIVNPLNLFYSDLIWLNPAPTTFFLILAFYLFMKEKWLFASIALAISTGFKQVSIIFFPLMIILLWRTKGFSKSLLYFILSYVGLVLLISAPYLFENPRFYLFALSFPALGTPSGYSSAPPTFSADLSQPVRLTFFLGLVKFVNLTTLASTTYQYLDYFFAIAFLIFLVYVLFRKSTFTKGDAIVLGLAAMLIFFGLFGRGIYKYYFASLTPLAIPFMTSKRSAILFELFSVAILLAPREVSPWMALLMLTFLPNVLGNRSSKPIERQASTTQTNSVVS